MMNYGKMSSHYANRKIKPKRETDNGLFVLILLLILFPISLLLVYNTKCEFLYWSFAIWKSLMSEFSCQEGCRHIYTLMVPNQNKDWPSEPNIYSIYCIYCL